ncbi:hypothetical protein JOD63_003445 [Microbacterium terrae]|uniref:PKD domain-containing protein n=1 Tax=Microbacterium terrae TaxID=69369 RepID=A0A0M2HIA3_9MICO|nr:hypothetical protein [Microbacterium terrae]KJL44520.1 hypothetical protein RS81_00514 [Microbacterium terrae]MBP1079477.1 hypothetical protein [Microbacterium terrae]GLJ96818.1 hypothetical protein GCM10017594_00150 [Microbacterium terrae]
MSTLTTLEPLAEHLDFGAPFIDIDEWRQQPIAHRYVHGGFSDSDIRFSFYLPTAEHYEGRFFQYITPVPESENTLQAREGEDDTILFALVSGAYLVETNGGGPVAADPFSGVDPAIGAYRANAAAATFSRVVAEEMYDRGRPFGYSFGGSGGAYRTVGGLENTVGVWDGAVPFVLGSPMAIPNCFTPRLHAMRILGDKLDDVVDAMDAGGSGDPYATLSAEQEAALREVSGMGFPLRSWYGHRTMGMHALAVLYPGVRAMDASYFDDFWTVPGYLGADPTSSVHEDRVVLATTIDMLLTVEDLVAAGVDVSSIPGASTGNADDAWLGRDQAAIVGAKLAVVPTRDPGFAELVIGPDGATRIVLMQVLGDVVVFGPADPGQIAALFPGAPVTLDNSGFLAVQTYHRHQVPGPEYSVWGQFRDVNGDPLYPQRPFLVGPLFTAGAAGTVPTGKFEGRVILVESLMDREAYPWQADWYRARVEEHLGADRLDGRFRLWLTDRALHADTDVRDHPDQSISYGGMLHQALRDLAAWVEQDIEPPASTAYRLDSGQMLTPASARERRGIQPTLTLSANGESRAEVEVGENVQLVAAAETPGLGAFVRFEWDLDGDQVFDVVSDVLPDATATQTRSVSFDAPGTYFVTVRGFAKRDPQDPRPFARLYNLARARIVVR